MNIEERILSQIQSQGIKPQARWVFDVKEYLMWALCGFLFTLLSISIGIIIYIHADTDVDVFENIETTTDTVSVVIPSFWIVIVTIVSFFIYRNTLKIKNGYKMRTERIVGASLLVGISLGVLLYEMKVAEYAEHMAAEVPIYCSFTPTTKHIWTDAKGGLLGGTITQWDSEQSFIIVDFNNRPWIISGSSVNFEEPLPNKGDKIKIIGRMIDDSHFDAIEIRNW